MIVSYLIVDDFTYMKFYLQNVDAIKSVITFVNSAVRQQKLNSSIAISLMLICLKFGQGSIQFFNFDHTQNQIIDSLQRHEGITMIIEGVVGCIECSSCLCD